MKKLLTAGVVLAASLTSISSGFAMSMEGNAMMKGDTMMKSEGSMTMSHDGMMKNEAMVMINSRMSVNTIARKMGYNWNKDRKRLAIEAGVKNYRGSFAQNVMIKRYLLGMKKDAMMMMKDEGVMVGGAMMIQSRDIVDNAVLASNVTTVVAAVKAAGLVDTLKSEGPFTVFAPNNAAFAKLPAGTVETLLKAESKATLVDILTYHVVAGRYKSIDLTDGLVLTTVEGKTLKFTRVDGKLMINGSVMVETADVISKNGVTHVIDEVLLPPQ